MKFRQSKGNNSSITEDIMMKLHVHNHAMVIYIQYEFHEIPSIGYLVMAEDRKKLLKFWQSKNHNSTITDATLMKLHVHNHTMVIYGQYMFHEIQSIGYLVMTEDGKTDGHPDGQTPNLYPSAFGQG